MDLFVKFTLGGSSGSILGYVFSKQVVFDHN